MIDFISVPVTAGFCSAAAITIASSQLKSLFGLEITHKNHDEGIIGTWQEVIENFESVRASDATMGLICIVLLLLMRVSKFSYYTVVWKLQNFSVTLILREIKVGKSEF